MCIEYLCESKIDIPPITHGMVYFRFVYFMVCKVQFNSVQSLSHVQLFVTPWIAAHQASLSITNSQSLPKLMSIESVMPSNHLILCHSLFLLPSIFPSIRVFSNESALRMKWPKYWSFSFNISPSMNTQDWWSGGWSSKPGVLQRIESVGGDASAVWELCGAARTTAGRSGVKKGLQGDSGGWGLQPVQMVTRPGEEGTRHVKTPCWKGW